MIVCHCNAVCDRAIRRAIHSGARTRRAVAKACRAGEGCGGCTPLVDAILASEVRREPSGFASPAELAATG